MVTAIIKIEDNTNQVLNIIKAKYNLKDKSKAIDVMAQEYAQEILDAELRPEYVRKLKKIKSKKGVKFNNISGLKRKIRKD